MSVLKSLLKSTNVRIVTSTTFPTNVSIPLHVEKSVVRRDLLQQAWENLTRCVTGTTSRIILLYGMPGSGKTHLARALAERWIGEGNVAYWMDASSAETLELALLRFAMAAGIHSTYSLAAAGKDNIQELVCNYLRDSTQPWLLILDNHDVGHGSQVLGLGSVLSAVGQGRIIITSRNEGLKNIYTAITHSLNVQEMQNEEAVELFCKSASIAIPNQSSGLGQQINHISVDLMGCLPLALAQAGCFIGQLVRDGENIAQAIDNYIADYEVHRERVLQEVDGHFLEQYGQPVVTLFDMSFRTIERKNDTASRLLLFFSFYHHRLIRLRWFDRASASYENFQKSGIDFEDREYSWFARLIKASPGRVWSRTTLNRSLRILSDYGLLNVVDDQNPSIDIHPLIHSWSGIFLQNHHQSSLTDYARLAAAVLCEVYDRDAQQIHIHRNLVRAEVLTHTEAWYSVTRSQTKLLSHPVVNGLPTYTLCRMADYLQSSGLHQRHQLAKTVIKLRLLTLASDLSPHHFLSRLGFWSLRRLIQWMMEDHHLDRQLALSAFTEMDSWLETIDSLQDPAFDLSVVRLELIYERMLACRGRPVLVVEVAKQGLDYITRHAHDLPSDEKLTNIAGFHTMIGVHDEDPASRMRSLEALKRIYEETVVSLGHDNACTARLLHQLRSVQLHNDQDAEGLARSSPGSSLSPSQWSGEPFDDPTDHQIRTLVRSGKAQTCSEISALLRTQHEAMVAKIGRWHPETLEKESQVLRQEQDQIPGHYSNLQIRWLTRSDTLIVPVEVAMSQKINTGESEKNYWSCLLGHWEIAKEASVLCDQISDLFLRVADAGATRDMGGSMQTLREVAHNLRDRTIDDPYNKRNDARVTYKNLIAMSRLWHLLEIFEDSVRSDQKQIDPTLQTDMLSLVLGSDSALQETLLYELIEYFLFMISSEALMACPILNTETLERLSTQMLFIFGEEHPLTYRWSIFQAISIRNQGQASRAEEVEQSLLASSQPASNEPPINSRVQIPRGMASNEYFNSQMKGTRVIAQAVVAREHLAAQYGRRGWRQAQASLYAGAIAVDLPKLGISSAEVARHVFLVCIACSHGCLWTYLWTFLDGFKTQVRASPDFDDSDECRKFCVNMLNEVALKLLQCQLDRALISFHDWFRTLLNPSASEANQLSMGQLELLWNCAGHQRLAYLRLGLPDNSEWQRRVVEEIEQAMNDRFGEGASQLADTWRAAWQKEREAWLQIDATGRFISNEAGSEGPT